MWKYTLIIISALLTAACGSSEKPESKAEKSADEKALVVGTTNTLSSLPLWVAEEEGVFDSLGISIKVKDYRDQLECDMAFVKGKAKIILTDSVRVNWMTTVHKAKCNNLKTVAMPLTLVANAKARISNLKQMKEKIMAVTRHSSAAEYGNHCIDSVKLNRDDVYVVQINDPNIALLMIQNNELDAAFMPEPQSSLALKGGHRMLYKNVAKGFVISAPDALGPKEEKAFKQAYDEAMKRIRENGQEHYKDLINKRCKL